VVVLLVGVFEPSSTFGGPSSASVTTIHELEELRNSLVDTLAQPVGWFEELERRLFHQSNGEQLYDLVVDIQSIRHLTEARGWPLLFRDEAVIDAFGQNKFVTLSVMGLYNRGKTHVLNQLSGNSFPAGLLLHTQGLSVMLPKKKEKILFVDTAGTHMPALESDFDDKILTERLLQDLVLDLADVNIIVINSLTLSDQIYITTVWRRLKELLVQQGRAPEDVTRHLIILHNFRELTEVTDVEQMIQDDLVHFSEAKKEEIGDSVYWTGANNLRHLVIAAENSPAGRKYNQMTYRTLYSWLTADTATALEKRGNFLDRLKNYINRNVPNYFIVDSEYQVLVRTGPPRLIVEPAMRPISGPLGMLPICGHLPTSVGFVPLVDVYVLEDRTIVQFDLQGVKPGNQKDLVCQSTPFKHTCSNASAPFYLEIWKVSHRSIPPLISIAGIRRHDYKEVSTNILREQRSFGSFGKLPNKKTPSFEVPLNSDIIYEQVSITWENGELTVELIHAAETGFGGLEEKVILS